MLSCHFFAKETFQRISIQFYCIAVTMPMYLKYKFCILIWNRIKYCSLKFIQNTWMYLNSLLTVTYSKNSIDNKPNKPCCMPWQVRPSPCSSCINIHYFMERFIQKHIPYLCKNKLFQKFFISTFTSRFR